MNKTAFEDLFFEEGSHRMKKEFISSSIRIAKHTVSKAVQTINNLVSMGVEECPKRKGEAEITHEFIAEACWLAGELSSLQECLDYLPLKSK